MATTAQIRQHFLKLGMPVSEVNQIIRDSILLGQTHNFINQWGLGSIQANTKYSGIFFQSKLIGRDLCKNSLLTKFDA